MRITIIQNIFLFLLSAIVVVLAFMQIIRGDFYFDQSVSNRIRIVSTDAPRGIIYDRNGVILADNHLSFNVVIIPQDVEGLKDLFNFLSRILKKDPADLQKLYLRRKTTPFEPVTIAEDVDQKTLIYIKENNFAYPGLEIQPRFERYYPFKEAGVHVLGYVGKVSPIEARVFADYGYTPLTLVGKAGVERTYENYLQGVAGGRQIEVNSRGKQVRLLSMKESIKGQDMQLTIDQRLQVKGAELLKNQRGSIVVMDLNNGEILSLVNAPDYNPNVFTSRDLQEHIEGYFKDPRGPMINRAVSGQFPPGSVFKLPVALAALERSKISVWTPFDCPGYYMLGKARFGCAHVHNQVNLYQAIARSCNVYFFRIAQMIGPAVIGGYAKAFGYSRNTGIDLPFESRGNLVMPHQKKEGWFTGNTLNLSIGQGDTLATPLQVTVMMAAIANNGIILKPHVLKALTSQPSFTMDLSQRPRVRLRDSTWNEVKKGMRMVVEDDQGTGHLLANIKNVDIWAKTGTAQAGRGQEHHAWFSGFLRNERNNLAFCVFLEHGGSSANAVAITHEFLQYMQQINIL